MTQYGTATNSDNFIRVARRVAATAGWNGRISAVTKIGLVLGGGVLAGMSKLLPAVPTGQAPWASILGWTGIIAIFMGGSATWLLERDQSGALAEAADALADARIETSRADQTRAERDQAEDLAYRQARLVAVSTALREAAEEVLISGPGDSDAQRTRLGRMLDILASQKDSLFGMKDERWNFAIYLHDEQRKVLSCAACSRPTRAESDARHRDIAPGDGHVGKVFAGEREAVADDATKPEYRDMFEMTAAQGGKTDDAMVYRSIASVPIRLGAASPFGVLVATTDRPGRFWPRNLQVERAGFDTVEPLRVCAGTLAIVLQVSNLYLSRKGE